MAKPSPLNRATEALRVATASFFGLSELAESWLAVREALRSLTFPSHEEVEAIVDQTKRIPLIREAATLRCSREYLRGI